MRLNAFSAIALLLVFVLALLLPALLTQAAPLALHPQLSAGFLFLGELAVFVPGLKLEGSWPLLSLYTSTSLLYATSGRWHFPLGRGSARFFNELGVQVPLGKGFWQLRYGAGMSFTLCF